MSKTDYYWERIPATIVSLEKNSFFSILRIEATLKSRKSPEREFHVTWVYGPTIKTSDKMYGNFMPKYFNWAYNHAEEGMEVILHHCMDDHSMYFYES